MDRKREKQSIGFRYVKPSDIEVINYRSLPDVTLTKSKSVSASVALLQRLEAKELLIWVKDTLFLVVSEHFKS